jgi:hypothetical protein
VIECGEDAEKTGDAQHSVNDSRITFDALDCSKHTKDRHSEKLGSKWSVARYILRSQYGHSPNTNINYQEETQCLS